MNLLFLHERFGAWAGAEANLLASAVELIRRGHQVRLLHGAPTGRDENPWKETFPTRVNLETQSPAEAWAKVVDGFKPDLVYLHKLADLRWLQWLTECGVPVVRMNHDHDLYCMRSYKYNFLTREVCHRALSPHCIIPCGAVLARQRGGLLPVRYVSYGDKKREVALNRQFAQLIVGSDYMQQELLRNGFSPSQIQIHAPVPPAPPSAPLSQFSDRNLLLYVGQVIRGKGVDLLLRALARVQGPFECLILGDGNHRAACESLSRKLGLEGRVCFKGFVPQRQLAAYYSEASALLVSSVWPEPFGAVGLEAMRHGVPVIGFDAGGIRDWLHHEQNGFLVPWMDVPQFATRVQQLLNDKELGRAMGRNGLELLEQRFGFADYITGLEATFRNVLRSHQPEEALQCA